MKLSNIEGHEAIELFPTIEIAPVNPRTAAYLDHNAIPVQFTNEDFDQVATGNYVTKVIYLPDPEFQDLALANVETLVSTRLDPGDDPIVEADRRGSIMAILRKGNKVKAVNPAMLRCSTGRVHARWTGSCPRPTDDDGSKLCLWHTAPAWGTPMTATNVMSLAHLIYHLADQRACSPTPCTIIQRSIYRNRYSTSMCTCVRHQDIAIRNLSTPFGFANTLHSGCD